MKTNLSGSTCQRSSEGLPHNSTAEEDLPTLQNLYDKAKLVLMEILDDLKKYGLVITGNCERNKSGQKESHREIEITLKSGSDW